MFKNITLILLFLILVTNISAQDNKIAIYLSNPIGMFHKAGGKLEYRGKKMGILFGATQYYGAYPKFPGTQLGLEYRKYLATKTPKEYENFLYLKAIAGHQNYYAGSGSGFTRRNEVPEGDYAGFGGGVGRHYNLKRFFFDFNTGLKYTVSEVKQTTAFYVTGPASFLDFQVHVGIQF